MRKEIFMVKRIFSPLFLLFPNYFHGWPIEDFPSSRRKKKSNYLCSVVVVVLVVEWARVFPLHRVFIIRKRELNEWMEKKPMRTDRKSTVVVSCQLLRKNLSKYLWVVSSLMSQGNVLSFDRILTVCLGHLFTHLMIQLKHHHWRKRQI